MKSGLGIFKKKPPNCHSKVVTSCRSLANLYCKSECGIRENFNTNEYPNIFVSKNLHERMSKYFRIKNLTQTNVQIYSFMFCLEKCVNMAFLSCKFVRGCSHITSAAGGGTANADNCCHKYFL